MKSEGEKTEGVMAGIVGCRPRRFTVLEFVNGDRRKEQCKGWSRRSGIMGHKLPQDFLQCGIRRLYIYGCL